jgi:hypothetical protein
MRPNATTKTNEWLRDEHDVLDRQQIKLFTFLVGQQELLAQKSALQIAGKTQIVARLIVEELAFHGIRNAEDVATCLNGYDQTTYPEGTQWSFTRFHLPQAFDAGCRLLNDAAVLWNAFEAAHHKATLPGRLEAPMESFARAVEVVLKDSQLSDAPGYCPDPSLWAHAVRRSGYVQSRHATGRVLVHAQGGARAHCAALSDPQPRRATIDPGIGRHIRCKVAVAW